MMQTKQNSRREIISIEEQRELAKFANLNCVDVKFESDAKMGFRIHLSKDVYCETSMQLPKGTSMRWLAGGNLRKKLNYHSGDLEWNLDYTRYLGCTGDPDLAELRVTFNCWGRNEEKNQMKEAIEWLSGLKRL